MNLDPAMTRILQETHYTPSHLTIKPGALELSAYGDRRAAHQDGFRAQEVYWSGRIQAVFWHDMAANTDIQMKTSLSTVLPQILIGCIIVVSVGCTLVLTKHDGGMSVERIKWTFSFAILGFLLKSQLSICIRLHRHTSLNLIHHDFDVTNYTASTNTVWRINWDERASEFILPCNHTQDQRRWFHTHTSCCLLSHAGSWYSSCSPSVNVFLSSNDYICSMCNVF